MSRISVNLSTWRHIAELIADNADPEIAAKAGEILMWADLRIENDTLTLDVASGLYPGWRASARIEERARLLSAIADYFPASAGRPLAQKIIDEVAAYEPSFSRNRDAGYRPAGLRGYIHDALALGNLPQKERLRKLLDDRAAGFLRGVAITQPTPNIGEHENEHHPPPAAVRHVRAAT